MAISTAAAIIGGSVISGVLGSSAARKSSKAQQAGIDQATAEQRRQFDITTQQLGEAEAQNRSDLRLGDISNRRFLRRASKGAESAFREGQRGQQAQLDPFAQAGVGALEQQQALLGLGTPEQQQAAFSSFQDSPGQRFIRERAQKSLLRNQAAIGGIGGGNVRSALVEQGAGFAAQDFGNQFNRLGQLRTSGQQAAGDIGQGFLTTGANIGEARFNALQQQGASRLNTAQLQGAGAINTAARQGQFGQAAASNIANLNVAGGQARASGILGQNQAIQSGLSGVFSGLSQGGFLTQPQQSRGLI